MYLVKFLNWLLRDRPQNWLKNTAVIVLFFALAVYAIFIATGLVNISPLFPWVNPNGAPPFWGYAAHGR